MADEQGGINALFQLTGVGVVETDAQTGRFNRVNRAFCEMVGYPEAALGELSFAALAPPDAPEALTVQEPDAAGRSLLRCLHRDGSVRWLERHATRLPETGHLFEVAVITDVSERVRTEEALRRREEELLLITENLPALIGYHDREERYLFTNAAFPEFFGVPREQILGHTIRERVGARVYARLEPGIKRALAGERVCFEDMEPDKYGPGRHSWTEEHYLPRFSPDGSVEGFFVLAVDITERKRAEAALRDSEARYRTLFTSIDEGFCVIELLFGANGRPVDYRYLEANPTFEQQAGLADVVGKTALEVTPGLEAHWIETYGEVALSGRPVRFTRRSGALGRWFDLYAFRLGDADSRKVAVLFRDVSEHQQAEEALRASEERLRLTVESISDYAILTVDAEGCISSWNSGAAQMFGYSEEVLGRDFGLIFCAQDREAGVPERELRKAREAGRAADERWYLRKDGSRFFAGGVTAPLRDGTRVTGYVKVARDLSAERRAEEERELLLEAVQDFNAVLERRVEERTAALKRSEQRFSQAFYANPIAACMTTLAPEERFLEVNDAFLELTGYRRGEVLGKTNHDLGLWSSAADQQKLEAAGRADSALHHLELQLRTKEGELRDILLSGETIFLEEERGRLKMFYDVTERKRTEEQLHRAISEVMTDTTWLSRRILDQLARLKAGGEAGLQTVQLSRREQQVLERVALGMTNDAIGRELGLVTQTVRNYISAVYDKLGVHSRAEAIVWARERGIVG
jgi:PAS domain S-box-containing protein